MTIWAVVVCCPCRQKALKELMPVPGQASRRPNPWMENVDFGRYFGFRLDSGPQPAQHPAGKLTARDSLICSGSSFGRLSRRLRSEIEADP
jgi:hypothetical protein